LTNKRIRFKKALLGLIRFQLKLAADALRDLLMSPVSIVCFLLDLVLQPEEGDSHHHQMLMFGRKTDRWINLFEEYRQEGDTVQDVQNSEQGKI